MSEPRVYQRPHRPFPAGVRVAGRAGLLLAGAMLGAAAAAHPVAPDAGAIFADPRLLDGMCYGVFFGLMTYALLMLLTFRDRVHVFFLLAACWSLLTIAILNGHYSAWMAGGTDGVAERIAGAVVALWVTFGALFGYRYMYMKRDAPVIGWVLLAVAWLAVLVALAALAGEVFLAAQAVVALAACGVVLMPLGTRPSRRFGFRYRGWYLFSTVAIFASLLAILGAHQGFLPAALVEHRYVQLAIVLQGIVYALALGMRVPRMHSQHGELHDRAAELALAAQTDPLTKLANRAGLASRALAVLGAEAACALLIIDLDHFKPINDEYGHEVGDEVLVRVAGRLARLADAGDTVARLGGDEFAILLTQVHSRDDLIIFAQNAIEAIRAPIELRGRTHRVGASLGIARHPEDGRDLSRLLRRADKALYRVKRQGRDGHAFFDEVPPSNSSLGRY
ncbi:MAG: diguanylate cyclase [Burkholderiales bacterium]